MSGWGFDSGTFGQLARTALSTATKQIDKVLDIDETQDPTWQAKSLTPSGEAGKQSGRSEDAPKSFDESKSSFWDSWDTKSGDGAGWGASAQTSTPPSTTVPSVTKSTPSRKSQTAGRSSHAGSSLKSPSKPNSSTSCIDTSEDSKNTSLSTAALAVESDKGSVEPGSSASGAKRTGRRRRGSEKEVERSPAISEKSNITSGNSTQQKVERGVSPAASNVAEKEANSANSERAVNISNESGVPASHDTGLSNAVVSSPRPKSLTAVDAVDAAVACEPVCTVGASSPVMESVSAPSRRADEAVLPASPTTGGSSNTTSTGTNQAAKSSKQRKSKPMVLGSGKGKSLRGKQSTTTASADQANCDNLDEASKAPAPDALLETPVRCVGENISQSSTVLAPDPLSSSTPFKSVAQGEEAALNVSPISMSASAEGQTASVAAVAMDGNNGEEPSTKSENNQEGQPTAVTAANDGGQLAADADDGWGESSWDNFAVDDVIQPKLSDVQAEVTATSNPKDTIAASASSDFPAVVTSDSTPNSDTGSADGQIISTATKGKQGQNKGVVNDSKSSAVSEGLGTALCTDLSCEATGDAVNASSTKAVPPIDSPLMAEPIFSSLPSSSAADAAVAEDEVCHAGNELTQCRHILSIRENKIVDLSRDNIDLQETNNILRNQIEQLERAHQEESADLQQVTTEFTERLAEMERRYQKKCRECDQQRQDLAAGADHSSDSRAHYEKMLKEKDESIEGLMAEGQKLSKQQLQHSNTIKKLRSKEKELEQTMSGLRRETTETRKALEKTQEDLRVMGEKEQKYQDSLMKVNAVAEKQSKELTLIKSSLEDEEEKVRGLQSALDNAYKELASLQKEKASNQSAAQEAALEAEVQARRELKQELEKCKSDSLTQQEALLLQISDLRSSMTRSEQLASRREDHLKQEISDLHSRIQEAEGHSQDLTNSVSGATRPLLRQIENLQSSHSAQLVTWEKLERNLTERLTDAQNQLAEVTEHDRMMSERVSELQTRLSTLESSSSSSRQDKARLSAELELLRTRFETIEEDRATAVAKLEALRNSYHQEMEGLRRDKLALNQQLDNEKTSATAERKRAAIAEERLEKVRL